MAETLGVTGSVPDVVSMALGVSDALAAGAGFNCSSLTIRFQLPEVKDETKPATAVETKTPSKSEKPVTAVLAPKGGSTNAPTLLPAGPAILVIGRFRDNLWSAVSADHPPTTNLSDRNTSLGLRVVKSGNLMVCTVCLLQLQGWDTKIGDQISMELTAPEASGTSTILSIFGFVNPMGVGFARFYGSLSVEATHAGVVTKPIGKMSIVPNDSSIFQVKSLTNGFFLNVRDNFG